MILLYNFKCIMSKQSYQCAVLTNPLPWIINPSALDYQALRPGLPIPPPWITNPLPWITNPLRPLVGGTFARSKHLFVQ